MTAGSKSAGVTISWFNLVPSAMSGLSVLLQVSDTVTLGRNPDADLSTPASAASTCASAAFSPGLLLSAMSIA